MNLIPFASLKKNFLQFIAVILIGTLGFHFISEGASSWVDCFYMTMITITTIGFGEIVDMSGHPSGRIFTITIALAGIGILTTFFSRITALLIEGHLSRGMQEKRMNRMINKMQNHYIICGAGRVGTHIAQALKRTGDSYVVIDPKVRDEFSDLEADIPYIQGDAGDEAILARAGADKAKGLFASAGTDNNNLVIALTARLLNPSMRIICRCEDVHNESKMRRAGADAVISPTDIGGIRMTQEMLQPYITAQIDALFPGSAKELNIDSLEVSTSFSGKCLQDLNLSDFPQTLILFLNRADGSRLINPPRTLALQLGDRIVMLSTSEEKQRLQTLMA